MITDPKLEYREARNYMGMRSRVPMSEFEQIIPQSLDELFAWLGKHNMEPAGAPFMRYHVINMVGNMDVELGASVTSAVAGDNRVAAGVLPAGRYASLVYTGIENGVEGNKALPGWGAAQGLVWDSWETEQGDAFGARLESYLTSPEEEPNPAEWETEVTIRLHDDQRAR